VLLAAVMSLLLLAAPTHASASASGTASRFIVTLRGFDPAVTLPRAGNVIPNAAAAEALRLVHLDSAISALGDRLGIRVEQRYHDALQGFAAALTPAQQASLSRDPEVLGITPVRPVRPAGGVVPPGVRRVEAQPQVDGGPLLPAVADINVAVVDTGIRALAHDPDLNVNAKGIDCADDATNGKSSSGAWADVDSHAGHGTHVAGIIGAKGRDVYGVAPGVRLFAVRVFASRNGKLVGDTSTVACGLDWIAATHSATPPAGTRPIDVVNMSIQGPRAAHDPADCPTSLAKVSDPEHRAVCAVARLGVTIVGAAGNSGRDASTSVPAAWSDVIGVGAIADYDGKPGGHGGNACAEPDDDFASFSNHGSAFTLVAPGVCVLSLGLKVGSTRLMSGTSMAAPHVAGAAARLVALFRARGRSSSPAAIRRALIGSASLAWNASTDPDGVAHRLLDVAAAEATTPSVAMWALPTTLTLTSDRPGASVQVQLQRRGLYVGDVSLEADAPSGLTVDLMPQTAATHDNPAFHGLGASGTERVIRVAANGIADGSYTITLHAIRAGQSAADPKGSVSIPVIVDTRQPAIGGFRASLLQGGIAGSAQPLELDWNGSDAGSGITAYTLQRNDGSGWQDISPFPRTSTSAIGLAPVRQITRFRVRARDGVGNLSPWATVSAQVNLRDSDKSSISYTGGGSWKTRTDPGAIGGSVQRSRTADAFAITSFTGTSVSVVAPTGSDLGTFKVSVDGGAWTTVDLDTPKDHERRVVFAAGGLGPGDHNIEVKVVTGTVDIDAFEFLDVSP
jgi:subtilisin